ncbi:hypothetical protein KJZ61_01960 [Candidatus Dependentiae bacterium]|nr:hypothetical protein [Candidatus Dependentiae bacterium]
MFYIKKTFTLLLFLTFLLHTRHTNTGFSDWLPWKWGTQHSPKAGSPSAKHGVFTTPFGYGQIKKGRYYAQAIMDGNMDKIPHTTRQETLATLVSLAWYFCSGTNNSIEKAQNFKEGAFLIPRNFFTLVEHYLKQVEADGYSIEGWYRGPNPFAYYRASSHLKKITKNRHIGIDICFDKKHGTQALLPGRKRHLLFIDYGDAEFIYMKPENYGIYGIVDAFLHGAEFIVEALGRIGAIRTLFCMKHDDHPIYHKEQIPADVKKAYHGLLKTCGINRKSEDYNKHRNSIAAMYNHAQILKTKIPNKYTELSEFTTLLESRFTYPTKRIGNEIIIASTRDLEPCRHACL